MQKQEAEEIFEAVCRDAQAWLAQANQLKMSADIIAMELQDKMARIRFEQGLDSQFLAFLKSYMLMIGMAFENLVKGILVGRDPSLVSRELISNKLLPRGGHGISDGAKKVCSISNEEFELLRRLEEYLVWAGKYPMPLKSEVFLNSQTPENLRSFSWADFELINKYFDRLAEILDNEWSARERSKYA
jgi:hypothetical protein